MEAYCLKCRTQREMKDPSAVTMKNGKPATKGTTNHTASRLAVRIRFARQ